MSADPSRRDLLRLLAAGAVASALPACSSAPTKATRVLRVGILHSLTGPMAPSEGPVALATRMAVAEWNGHTSGGDPHLAGRVSSGITLEAISADGASDPETFAREAGRLVSEEGVAALFGCWTSSSRKAVLPVVESLGNFLVYPLQYEGLESSANVLYTGATPNQQLLPGLRWAMGRFGTRVYFVGSDYVFPRVANAVMRDQLGAAGGAPVGEAYLPLNASGPELQALAAAIVVDIRRSRPDVIVSTLNGLAGNMALFSALRAEVPASELPTLSFSIGAPEARAMSRLGQSLTGEYAGWSWLPDANDAEAAALWSTFGTWAEGAGIAQAELPDGLTDPMVNAIAGVRLWASAAAARESGQAASLASALAGSSTPAPGGRLFVDQENQHVWHPLVVGQFTADARLSPVFRTALSERPRPYPAFRSRTSWERILAEASSA